MHLLPADTSSEVYEDSYYWRPDADVGRKRARRTGKSIRLLFESFSAKTFAFRLPIIL